MNRAVWIALTIMLLCTNQAHSIYKITPSCLEKCVAGDSMDWQFNLSNEANTTVEITRLRIVDTNNLTIVSNNQAIFLSTGQATQIMLPARVPSPINYTYFFFKPCITYVVQNKTPKETCYAFENITVYPKNYSLCENDANCTGTQYCNIDICFELSCSGCTYAFEHSCKPHQCCSNDICAESNVCSKNTCIPLICTEKEAIMNHTCTRMNCTFFENEKNHQCVENYLLTAGVIAAAVIALLLIIAVFIVKYKIKGRTIATRFRTHRKVIRLLTEKRSHLEQVSFYEKLASYAKTETEKKQCEKKIKFHKEEAKKKDLQVDALYRGYYICPNCGRRVKKDSSSCGFCGEDLKEE